MNVIPAHGPQSNNVEAIELHSMLFKSIQSMLWPVQDSNNKTKVRERRGGRANLASPLQE
jgi:hypothetical protein